jgi:hypothetical protein
MTKLYFDIESPAYESLVIALNIALSQSTRVGDIIGFNVGKKHFTLVKDTGHVSKVEIRRLNPKKNAGENKKD